MYRSSAVLIVFARQVGGGGEITCGGDDASPIPRKRARWYIPVHEYPRTANTRHVEKKNHVLRLQSREIQIAFLRAVKFTRDGS